MRRPLLLVLGALSVGATLVSVHALKSTLPALTARQDDRAFLNARWGMHPADVEHANGSVLKPVVDSKRFFYDANADLSRYRSFEQDGVRLLGRPAKATYTFHDDRLFAFHVFVSDADGERLDEDMRRYLKRVFGERFSDQDEESTLKLVWQFQDRIVNYWFMQDELSLRSKFTAGFGVTDTKN